MFWTNPRGYRVEIWFYHFVRGVRFGAAQGQEVPKSSIENTKFSQTVAEHHCLCCYSIQFTESRNGKSRTLPNFFPLSQISGFGCLTTCTHWCMILHVMRSVTDQPFFYLIIMIGPPRNRSLRAQVWDRVSYHSAMSTWGWTNFVYIYFIFLIKLM